MTPETVQRSNAFVHSKSKFSSEYMHPTTVNRIHNSLFFSQERLLKLPALLQSTFTADVTAFTYSGSETKKVTRLNAWVLLA